MSKYDAIPDELKERDQWLMWDSSADTPRRPHWAGNFGISWSDPDDWHSFEEAVATATQRGSWGIGYVMALDNDDHARGLYGCLDLDGCIAEDGGPKDWLPSLEPFLKDRAYAEYSASGEGIHIPLVGQQPPEWWSDSHFSADEHEGVEYLTNKFVAFTGDAMDGCGGSEVADTNPAPFLFDAYKELNGESPRFDDADDHSSRSSDDELTEEEVENALDALDAGCEYPLWRNLAFAVHDWDSGPTGKSLFESWSRSSSAWDEQSQRLIDNIWDNSTQGDGVTVGTLVHHAMEAGWSPGRPSPPEPPAEAETDGGETDTDGEIGTDNESAGARTGNGRTTRPDPQEYWEHALDCYSEDFTGDGRISAASALEAETSWMWVLESETLYTYDSERGWFSADGEAYAQRRLEARLGSHYSISERNEIVEKIKARHQTKRRELNAGTVADPVLCVGNGVIDFSTGELRDHDPKYKFTRGIEYEYDPESADTEAITDFLDSLTTRTEDRDTLLDHLAHGLMPGHPYRAFVITYGPGGNGKTQLGELFRGFVGSDNAAAVELQDLTGEDDFASGALPSAFINVGDDVSVGEIRNTSILKTVTGGGTLRANEKHEKRYDFKNEAAMFFSANEPPRIAEDKQSIADRLYPIEMPYRFVDDPDPDNVFEAEKVPGISDQLLSDDAAMRGLLALVVDHGQRLVETNGQYSMPEGPQGRRAIYEAASDPIQRFALSHLQEGDGTDVILKDDAYSVYTKLCDRDSERPAAEDGFKRKISQQSIIDVESGQTRRLTDGDGAATCWKYVQFTEAAKELMPDRLVSRYFPGDELDDDVKQQEDRETDVEERQAFGASPIRDASQSVTGYVTVTVEVVTTRRLGEDDSGLKAILKDATGAMDLVSWDADTAQQIEDLEGQCVVVQNAEIGEYDGSHQLSIVDGLTTISKIQRGVGYTGAGVAVENANDGENRQVGLKDATAVDDAETADPKIIEQLRLDGEMSIPQLAGSIGEDPDYVSDTVDKLAQSGDVIVEDGSVRLND